MRKIPNKADKEPTELSARTLRILMSWEKKHGLVVIRQHLDDGLFSRDPWEYKLCYRWLEQRRAAQRNNVIAEIVISASAVVGIVSYLIWAD